MQTYIDDVEETISLSNFHKEDDTTSSRRSLSSSSSSSLSDDQDFLGFFSDEWNGNTSYGKLPENIVFCGKVISFGEPMARDGTAVTKTQLAARPLFRSSSDSFRFMPLNTSLRPSTTRSKSLPNRPASFPYKSKLMLFMCGSGSSKFLNNKMEMSDIKSRQVRRQSSMTSAWVESGKKKESGGHKSGSKGWWRVVDVLGCGGGYEKDTLGVDHPRF